MSELWAITNCRVSSDEQLKNNSLNTQQRNVIRAAGKLGATIPKDGQWSGSRSSKRGKNIKRSDLLEMYEYCKKHKKVKYLIVSEPDRFMRSIEEAMYWEARFRYELGVKVWYANDDDLNTDDMQAKMMKFVKYFTAEGSNEERQRKSVDGQISALVEGRYPYIPKLGYMKGDKPGIHKLAPEIGETMRTILNRLADGVTDLSTSLVEFNESDYVKSGKHCRYKLDHWRHIVVDPYYAGIVEMHKQVDMRNEHGLHEAIITKEQHMRIVDIVNSKKKTQPGPRKNGNPNFPLSTIALCEDCTKEEEKAGKTGRHNQGKYVGYEHGNGHTQKRYYRYRCRRCKRSFTRDELHGEVTDYLNHLDFSSAGRKELENMLSRVWKREEENIYNQKVNIQKTINSLEKMKDESLNKLITISNPTVSAEIEKSIEHRVEQIQNLKDKLYEIENNSGKDKANFVEFALELADHWGIHFFNLTPDETKKCKDLLFPNGFLVKPSGKVYTTQISPLYRLRESKKESKDSTFDYMVIREGLEPSTPSLRGSCSNQLSYRTKLCLLYHISSLLGRGEIELPKLCYRPY